LEGKSYPWGDEFACEKGNFDTEAIHNDYIVPGGEDCDWYRMTAPVGSFDPNNYGLYDMSGNVKEWVNDWYDPEYYADSPQENPRGHMGAGPRRVVRGGSWGDGPYELRVTYREGTNMLRESDFLGFRCARDASP
jgi:formylglycine-generating enzyme required for sulfatase activity